MINQFQPVTNQDYHSFARPEEAVVTHLELNLAISFEDKIIHGQATYSFKAALDAKEIIFDTRDLVIEEVVFSNGKAAIYKLGQEKAFLGQPLHINISSQNTQVTIKYKTTSKSAALQWLNPEQTAGKLHPFLFTQSQAILARTWLPCQDSPGIRFTYSATILVPAGFLPLMSATNPQKINLSNEYNFQMKQPYTLLFNGAGGGEFRI